MDMYHAQEIASLIGGQWDLREELNRGLKEEEKQLIRKQMAENAYRIASIIDLYQNANIRFYFQKNIFVSFSEVIRHPEFDFEWEEVLLKRVFELHFTTVIEVIDVENVGRQRDGIFEAVIV